MSKKTRAMKIISELESLYPKAASALNYQNPLQCMIATILSAQCTDAQVNKITPQLFRKYPDAEAFANATLPELENDIRSTGFFRNKAKAIRQSCQSVMKDHAGFVPDTIEKLLTLTGIGRKTANCVIGNAYGKPAVMVDTHVKRLVYRMGLSAQKNPDKIEMELKRLLPESLWTKASHLLIHHGRQVCSARKPKCEECSVNQLCLKKGI
ncbi:endonuclease III [bacterium]|nr:endonuclease III [candidate division CSSED10-310 bacterium]